MCDLPPTVDLPPAESRPPAHIDLNAVGLCSDHPIDGMTKRKVVTGLDAEFTYFETHVTVKRPQPFGEARSQQIRSLVLERLHVKTYCQIPVARELRASEPIVGV